MHVPRPGRDHRYSHPECGGSESKTPAVDRNARAPWQLGRCVDPTEPKERGVTDTRGCGAVQPSAQTQNRPRSGAMCIPKFATLHLQSIPGWRVVAEVGTRVDHKRLMVSAGTAALAAQLAFNYNYKKVKP